jgi:hypothetical protein
MGNLALEDVKHTFDEVHEAVSIDQLSSIVPLGHQQRSAM